MTRQTKAYLALIFICIVWGTTYLAIRVAVQHFPAFLFAGIRQSISGIIILIIALFLNRNVDLSLKNILHQATVGFLLITVGNGLVSWGEKTVPSGIAAIICSLMPIVSILFNLLLSKKEKINGHIVTGMLVGFGGVGLIFKDDLIHMGNTDYLKGSLGILIATSSWALGSVINKQRTSNINPVFNSGIQVLAGGLLLFLFSPVMDTYEHMDLFNRDVFLSLLYLILFGSVLAYTAYMFALKELPVGIVSLYAYVNPLVAVVMGYWFLEEALTVYTVLAFISILAGVYLVNFGYRKQHKQNEVKDFGNNAIAALPESEC